MSLKSLRMLIGAGAWPAGDEQARRLALRVASRIEDAGRQHDLRERLLDDLATIELETITIGNSKAATQSALATLDEIEAESGPDRKD